MSFRRISAALSASLLSTLLIGCSANFAPPSTSTSDVGAMTGSAYGGRFPIVGAHIYVLAAGTFYAGPRIPPTTSNASVSLLKSVTGGAFPTTIDSNGNYFVTTDANGIFTFAAGSYTCTVGSHVYLYSIGGKPDTVNTNSAAGLLAILGDCPASGTLATQVPFVSMNEVSTVAAAYAMAGYATDATHVGTEGAALAEVGISNAFANAAQMYSISGSGPGGGALATTPGGNGSVPQALINTLANVLAACVNSSGPGSSQCTTLFSDEQLNGNTGGMPTDTASAAINLAHYPANHVAALFNLPTGVGSPFTPNLGATAPNDFTIAISFTDPSLDDSQSLAVDAAGNVWTANSGNSTVSAFSPTGQLILTVTGGGLNVPGAIAVDSSGNVWVANDGNNTVSAFSSSGTVIVTANGGGLNDPTGLAMDATNNAWIANISGSDLTEVANDGTVITVNNGLQGGGLNQPIGIAVDGAGAVWVANAGGSSLSVFSNAGVPHTPGGYSGGGLDQPSGIAIDSFGQVWVANTHGSSVSEFTNTGIAVSGSGGFTGGGLSSPESVAMDGYGNAWVANVTGDSISAFDYTGTPFSGSNGYKGGGNLSNPYSVVIDGSGNAWASSVGTNTLVEFIGIAVPVITPISAALPSTPSADGSSNLATRP